MTTLHKPGQPGSRSGRVIARRAPPIDVLLVDDHAVVRAGLKQLFISQDDIRVVGEAATEADAIAEAQRTRPAVVLMDVRLAGGDGVSATRAIRARLPETKVLMLSAFADDEALAGAVEAGASGFLLKGLRSGEIVQAVRAAARGDVLFDPEAARLAAEHVRKGKHLSDDRLARLSPQEERVLEQLARGLTNGEIAAELDLAEKTVKNYVSNVLLKLGVDRRAEAAAYFTRHTAAKG